MFEFGNQLQEALLKMDPKAEVFVHGKAFRDTAAGNPVGDPYKLDYLVISQKLTHDQVSDTIDELGGNGKYSCTYPSRQAFLRSRHFTVDQGALTLDGEVAEFATKQCLDDIGRGVIRPSVWATEHDPTRKNHSLSAALCGRAVRLAGQGFAPTRALADYIKANWSTLLGSRSFRWQATKSDAALRDAALVPQPMFAR